MDAHRNFAYWRVAVAPDPPDSGTALTVVAGAAAPTPPPFNVTVWPADALPLFDNAEICTVTAVDGDVFTLVRAAEPDGMPARAIQVGDQIAATITDRMLNQLASRVFQAAVGQTGNLQEWRAADGTLLGYVTVDGALVLKHPMTALEVRALDDEVVFAVAADSKSAYAKEWQVGSSLTMPSIGGELRADGYQPFAIINPIVTTKAPGDPESPEIVPLTVQAIATQTVNLQEWKDSAGNVIAAITPEGNLILVGTVNPP